MTLLIVYMLYSSNDLINSVCCTVVMTLISVTEFNMHTMRMVRITHIEYCVPS